MKNSEFPDYYEVMEVRPNAGSETIERLFRYLGQRLHPDHADTGNDKRLRSLLEAYDTLKDPQERAAYDAQYREHLERKSQLIKDSAAAGHEIIDQHRMLAVFRSHRD